MDTPAFKYTGLPLNIQLLVLFAEIKMPCVCMGVYVCASLQQTQRHTCPVFKKKEKDS